MLLRPYQSRLVDRAVKALSDRGNTLAVAATGAGKTICLAAIGQRIGGKQLVLQHRLELVQQNLKKYQLVNPTITCGLWTADVKTFRNQTTFAMVQSLAGHVEQMPKFDLIIADEAHHCAAPSWERIINAAREKNPDVLLAGFTATPSRSDRKGLRKFFDNVCDQVSIGELVGLGFLVAPRAFVVDTAGTKEALAKIKTTSDFGDQTDVAEILNTDVVNAEVIRHWHEHAENRPTVVFCSTVAHAEDVATAFTQAGIPAACVHGQLSPGERKSLLNEMTQGRIRVITNCMVLTEGWDYPPVSCVILLRRCSDKSPLIQMVGRGLRTVNQAEFPGIRKKDCIVLDFGQSLLTHGDLTADVTLGAGDDDKREPGEAITKLCPNCEAELPIQTRICPFCDYEFISHDSGPITHVDLTEMDILRKSPFRYCDLFASGLVMVASGFEAFVCVASPDNGNTWFSLGKSKNEPLSTVYCGDKIQAMAAADDFMRTHESERTASKSRRWLNDPASEKQIDMLTRMGFNPHVGYSAAAYPNTRQCVSSDSNSHVHSLSSP